MAATSGESRAGFHTPVAHPEALLCGGCWEMDLGQEDWLIRYSSITDRIDHMYRDVRLLRGDTNVSGVDPVRTYDDTRFLWVVRFNTGARAPADEELAGRVAARRTWHLREDPLTATETSLVNLLRERYTDMDLSPGSVLRGLISNTAAVINQLQSQSIDQARNQIVDGLTRDGFIGVPGQAVDAMAAQAMEAQQRSREALIRDFLDTPGGRARLAASMVQPIRDSIHYTQLARESFPIQQLPPGALPLYDRDPGVAQMVADPLGVPSDSLVSNVGKHWCTPANPEATVVGKVVRTRWQRLLDDEPFG